MIGIYNYTVILTYLSTISGFTGIIFILNNNINYALICLIISGICDAFDGKLANTKKRNKKEKRFGIQIDSLSDLICFGLLPALIVIAYHHNIFSYICGSIYVLCALIRLAWFNVDEEIRQDQEKGNRRFYLGLPVTISSAIIPLFVIILNHNQTIYQYRLSIILLIISILFITPIKFKKIHI